MVKKIFSVVLAVAFISGSLISCQNDENSSVDNSNSKNQLTGEQLFKSVMFGTGEFAKTVPTLAEVNNKYASITPEQKIQIESRIDELVSSIKTENSSFFNDFKMQIVSGNHNEIKNALESASIEIADRLEILVPGFNKIKSTIEQDIAQGNFITDKKIDSKRIEEKSEEYTNLLKENFVSTPEESLAPCSWAVVCVAYFAVAVHNTAAVTANIAVALNVWKWLAITSSDSVESNLNKNSLQVEILINELAQAK